MTCAIRFVVQKERGREYTVWTASIFTGSKQDCCGWFASKRSAQAFIDDQYRKYEQERIEGPRP